MKSFTNYVCKFTFLPLTCSLFGILWLEALDDVAEHLAGGVDLTDELEDAADAFPDGVLGLSHLQHKVGDEPAGLEL